MLQAEDTEREELIKKFLPCIQINAYKLFRRLPAHLTINDLISVGTIGLMDAFDKYIPGKGKFKTYAEFRIKGSMLDELRALSWLPRSVTHKLRVIDAVTTKLSNELNRAPSEDEIRKEAGLSLQQYDRVMQYTKSDMISMEGLSNALDSSGQRNILDCIQDAGKEDIFSILEAEDDRTMVATLMDQLPFRDRQIILLYYFHDLKMKEAADLLDITESRFCQLHGIILEKLKIMHQNHKEV